jgi:WD40 repeat protein
VVWQPLAPGVHPIYTVAMTKDGRFAACGRSNQLFVYDLATRQFVTQIVDEAQKSGVAHRAMVQALAFSPDGTRLASGSYREVKIWRQEKGKATIRKAEPTLGAVTSVLTNDGRQMISADKTGALLVLDPASGKVIKKIADANKSGVKLLSVSPDATKVAVFGADAVLSIWNLTDAKLLASKSVQGNPDPAIEKQSKDAQDKLTASVSADVAALARLKAVQEAKAAAAKEEKEIQALVTKAPGGKPDAALQQRLKEVQDKLAASVRNEADAVAASKATQAARATAQKLVTDVTALVAKARDTGVRVLIWTGDGRSVVTAGADKTIRVWSIPAVGSTDIPGPKELKGATGAIVTMLAGATPDQLITAGEDGKVRTWSITEAKVLREIASAGILSLGLARDGKQLVTGGADGAMRIWDIESGKQTSELRGNVAASQKMAALEWTIGAQGLEQAFHKTEAARIDAQNKALDELLKKANETIVAVDKVLPEKQKAVKAAQEAKAAAQKAVGDVAALIAKAADGKPDAALEKQQKDAQDKLTAATMPETSALAALSAVESNVKDARTELTRITDAKAKNSKDIAAANAALAASQKTQEKAAADLAAARSELTKTTAKPLALAFSADAQKVAVIFSDGTLNILAVASGMPVEQMVDTATTAASLIASANGSFLACNAGGTTMSSSAASRWVLERVLGGEKDHTLFADRVNAVSFSPDGKTLATGGGEPSRSGDIHLFDAATGKQMASWNDRHEDVVLSLDFSPDGKLLASGGADKIARVSEIATGRQVNLFEAHTHYVMGVAFRADGRILATAGADGVVNVWNMLMGERKKKIEGWTKEVTSLQFIGATNQIVTSAGDNLVRIVNDEGSEVRSIAKLPNFMQAAASAPNASTIIGGGEDSFLRVWDGTSGKELAVFGLK